MRRLENRCHIAVPDRYRIGHEAHFTKVTEKYLRFLEEGTMPDWEVPNMITKYCIAPSALEMACLAVRTVFQRKRQLRRAAFFLEFAGTPSPVFQSPRIGTLRSRRVR